jgi:hypothetical protein
VAPDAEFGVPEPFGIFMLAEGFKCGVKHRSWDLLILFTGSCNGIISDIEIVYKRVFFYACLEQPI